MFYYKVRTNKHYILRVVVIIALLLFSFNYYFTADTYSSQIYSDNLYSNANNFEHAYDNKFNTSANIFSQDGFIVFPLEELGIQEDSYAVITMNASDGSNKNVVVQTLDEDMNVIALSTSEISIAGFKNSYYYQVATDGVYLRVSGVSDLALYIYEIEQSTSPLPYSLSSWANNIEHGYDGNENTSANIFTPEGYIIYSLDELSLTPAGKASILVNSADGSAKSVTIEYIDNQGNYLLYETVVLIVGFKNTYVFDIPVDAEFIKINGISGAFLFVYEIHESQTDATPILGFNSNNHDHAYDGSYNTSANLFSQDGFIIYSLVELSVLPEDDLKITLNASDGRESEVTIISLDEFYEPLAGSETVIEIVGYKNQYIYQIHEDASFIRIDGIQQVPLYIYEIEKLTTSNILSMHKDANNLDHAYDGSFNTSANIFTRTGFIIYDIEQIGLTAGKNSALVMNTADGTLREVMVETYDENMSLISGSGIEIDGYKNTYMYQIPANAKYLKINGTSGIPLYIYEILGPGTVNPELSFASAKDYGNKTFLLEVTVFDTFGYPIEGLNLGSGGNFRAVNTGSSLPYPVHYFGTSAIPDVELISSENGVYKFLFTRPYEWTRTWNILVNGVEVQTGLLLSVNEDLDGPDLVGVFPATGLVELQESESFVLTVNAYDEFILSHLEIDHSLESILPEFNVYANSQNPYGSNEALAQFESYGVIVTYDEIEQEWVIDFGEAITDILVANGGITFYLVIYDMAGNQFGTMYGTTPENTFAYTITR